MDTQAIIVIVIAAVIIIAVDAIKGRMNIKAFRAHPPVSQQDMSWSRGEIRKGWVLMILLTNVFGLAAAAISRWISVNEYNALWLMAVLVGWLFSLAFIARPIAFPRDYRVYWDRQDHAPPGTVLLATFVMLWLAAMTAVSWSFITDLS